MRHNVNEWVRHLSVAVSGESRQKLEGGLKACIMPISVGLGLQVAELGFETSSKKLFYSAGGGLKPVKAP